MYVEYAGGMKFIVHHRDLELVTDQPADQGGDNTAMTPAEVFIASLGACIGVYVVTFAKRHGIVVEGLRIEVDHTVVEGPRRAGRVAVQVKLPQPVNAEQKAALQRAAETCFVHNTLRHPPQMEITVGW
jgi:putative redox protein